MIPSVDYILWKNGCLMDHIWIRLCIRAHRDGTSALTLKLVLAHLSNRVDFVTHLLNLSLYKLFNLCELLHISHVIDCQ